MAELIERTCPNCGGKMKVAGDADQLVCPYCGTEFVVVAKKEAIGPAPAAEPLKCPECNTLDYVQKVSSVYRAGLSRGSYTGHTWKSDDFVYVSGHSQTELSRLLSPPREPGSRSCVGIALFLYGLLMLTIPTCGILLVTMLRLTQGVGFIDIVMTLLGLLVLISFGYLTFRAGRGMTASKQRQYAIEKPRWERARDRWEHSYYCARDDGVFIPGETSFTPIGEFQSHLYAD